MSLRETEQMALEALADTQDWDEIEALRASLREHMAEIHRLRAAGRQALEALEEHRIVYLNDNDYLGVCPWCRVDSCDPCDEKCMSNNAITALRAALAEDAMQRLTDVQQEM